MSVLSCDVNDCPNIMCSRISYKLNKYICNDCFERIKSRGILNKNEILEFFNTPPPRPLFNDAIDVERYYNNIFKEN